MFDPSFYPSLSWMLWGPHHSWSPEGPPIWLLLWCLVSDWTVYYGDGFLIWSVLKTPSLHLQCGLETPLPSMSGSAGLETHPCGGCWWCSTIHYLYLQHLYWQRVHFFTSVPTQLVCLLFCKCINVFTQFTILSYYGIEINE